MCHFEVIPRVDVQGVLRPLHLVLVRLPVPSSGASRASEPATLPTFQSTETAAV